MINGPLEPHADIRQMANFWFQTYTALTQEGFTEQQALEIIGNIIRSSFGSSE